MKYIYRNYALEYLLKAEDYTLSPYGDWSAPHKLPDFSEVIFLNMLPREYDVTTLIEWIKAYRDSIVKTAGIFNKPIYVAKLQNYHYKNNLLRDNSLQESIDLFNNSILALGNNVYPIDVNDFSKENFIDLRYFYTYNALINPKHKKDFQIFLENKIKTFHKTPKKCLVLDLDNTLWGGILGEDGIGNLKISGNYPGNIYRDFQKLILGLKNIGVILCIASKNNLEDVEECFEKRDDMILSLDDFTIKKISWQSKDKSIIQTANELNIGLDSMVFVDDSIFERELIKTVYSQVEVLDFPQELYLLPDYFSAEFYRVFSKNVLTKEDVNRTELYKKKLSAEKLKQNFPNQEEYLKNLNMSINYQPLSDYNINRIVELINKTNQFNLTTQRYSLEDILTLSQEMLITAVSVSDKFGDLGLVGCSVVRINSSEAAIDIFLLSCRILGRNIEFSFMDYLLKDLGRKGIKKVKTFYKPTAKNSLVKDFYLKCGFKEVSKNDGCTEYEMVLKK